MNPVLLVGVLHLTGLRKKDNEPYDFYLLQYIDLNKLDNRVIGNACVNDVACEPDIIRLMKKYRICKIALPI